MTMHLMKVNFQPTNESLQTLSTIFLCENEWKKLNVLNKTAKIIWGKNELQVNIQLSERNNCTNMLSSDILTSLHIPSMDVIHTYYCKELNRFIIGPIIGLMTELKEDREGNIILSLSNFAKELSNYCKRLGLFFFLYSPDHLFADIPKGYFYYEDHWIKMDTPYPNVIYNRLHSKKKENHPTTLQLKSQWRNEQLPFFNENFLSKLDMYSLLADNPILQPYLPVGKPLTTESIHQFLLLYPSIYLKPIYGSQGKGIIKVTSFDHYLLFQSSDGKSITFQTIEELIQYLNDNIQFSSYMIQEGLDLVCINHHPVDFRYLCHKLNQHNWVVTFSTARISKGDSIVSNIAQGGELAPVKNILSRIFPDKSEMIMQMMNELAISICQTISSKNLHYAEIGIDLGVDHNGKVKVIEINSKPSKTIGNTDTTIRPSAKAIINYCYYCGSLRLEECCPCHHSVSSN